MDQETIVIKIRDSDPLCVSVKRLIEDGRLFRYLICELHFTELEMDDFHPDTVGLFLTLLEDKTVDDIQEGHFRELHKMCVVFEVDWLMESCREWLVNKISGIGSGVMEYEATLFLLEESRYILDKWELSKFVDLLTSKLAAMDNTAFISQYTRDFEFDKLDSIQLDIMLKLGGSNTKLFLEIVLQNVSGKQFLDSNIKHLLGKMNLALCLEQNEQLYDQMFETLLAMSELTTTDFRYIFKLSKDSARIAYSRNTKISVDTTVYDHMEWGDLCKSCNKLEDITSSVEDKRINNMFVVVDLLIYVTHQHSPTTEDVEVFVNSLENVCQDNPLNKVSPQHIDSIISALNLSPRQEKVQLIALLEKIKNNNKFCSCQDNVILSQSVIEEDAMTIGLLPITIRLLPITIGLLPIISGLSALAGTVNKVLFEFKHPGTPECHTSGKCGFIIKKKSRHGNEKLELCKQYTDYTDTGLHLHEIVSAEEMYYYQILSGTTDEGGTVKMPGRWPWEQEANRLCSWWLPNVGWAWGREQCCVAYNVSRYLVGTDGIEHFGTRPDRTGMTGSARKSGINCSIS